MEARKNRASRGKTVTVVAIVFLGIVFAAASWLCRGEIREWYYFMRHFEGLPANDQGFPEYRHKRTGIVFVRVPGGPFVMGTSRDEQKWALQEGQHEGIRYKFADEGPRRTVTLSPFLIAKYEVTQEEWTRIIGNNPSTPHRANNNNLPVENTSWYDCREFCEKAGLGLPTEAQWEYACRAGTEGRFGGTGHLDDMGWFRANSRGETQAVGRKRPNAFGLHDMHGNVWEWCEDIYDEKFYTRFGASKADPVCNQGVGARVRRGGSFRQPPLGCRSGDRAKYQPQESAWEIGLRPIFDLRASTSTSSSTR